MEGDGKGLYMTGALPHDTQFIRGPVLSGIDSIYLSKVNGNHFEIRGQYKSKVVLKNHTWIVDNIMKVNGSNQLPPLGLKLWDIGGEKLPIKLKITQVK